MFNRRQRDILIYDKLIPRFVVRPLGVYTEQALGIRLFTTRNASISMKHVPTLTKQDDFEFRHPKFETDDQVLHTSANGIWSTALDRY